MTTHNPPTPTGATARPWAVRKYREHGGMTICGHIKADSEFVVCDLPGGQHQEANARLIVRAVNAHADLVAFVRRMASRLDEWRAEVDGPMIDSDRLSDDYVEASAAARALLARIDAAKGGE